MQVVVRESLSRKEKTTDFTQGFPSLPTGRKKTGHYSFQFSTSVFSVFFCHVLIGEERRELNSRRIIHHHPHTRFSRVRSFTYPTRRSRASSSRWNGESPLPLPPECMKEIIVRMDALGDPVGKEPLSNEHQMTKARHSSPLSEDTNHTTLLCTTLPPPPLSLPPLKEESGDFRRRLYFSPSCRAIERPSRAAAQRQLRLFLPLLLLQQA